MFPAWVLSRGLLVILLFADPLGGQTERAPETLRKHPRPVPACAACHMQARSQPATSMAHGLETVEECKILSAHPLLTFKAGKSSDHRIRIVRVNEPFPG